MTATVDEVLAIIDTDKIQELHPGSVIRTPRGTDYIKERDGRWRSPSNRRRDWLFFSGKDMVLVNEAPAPVTIESDEETVAYSPDLTLTQYKQRFKTIALGAAYRNSVSVDPVHDIINALDIENLDPYPGMPVCVDDSERMNSLPVGTSYVVGCDPSDYTNYAVYAYLRSGYGWTRVLGGASITSGQVAQLLSIPGVEAPPIPEPEDSESELAAIRAFMVRAWNLGVKAKAANRWCGEYEAAMSRAGITANAEEGEWLTAAQVNELPEGTIVRFHVSTDASAIYIRDNRATNPAGTLRLGGALPGHWARTFMQVVRRAGTERRFPVLSHAELGSMPVGTVITDGSTHYTKRDTGRWYYSVNDNGYNPRDFGLSGLWYTSIPVPE